MIRAAAVALALLAGPAAAQNGLPTDRVPPEEMARFRDCRVAIYHHLDGPADPRAIVPQQVARTMLEQMTFVMVHGIRIAPADTIEDTQAALGFVERFFMEFAGVIATRGHEFTDLVARERMLMACQPIIWRALSETIEGILRDRGR